MASRTRALDGARRTWDRRRLSLGDELRSARLLTGARQADVALAIDVSATEISRRERGVARSVSARSLTEHAAAVGLRLVVTTYPIGGAVRDAAQLRYIGRLLARVSPSFARQLEAPVPIAGDLRAVDVVLRAPNCVIAVEVITRLGDVQAQIRSGRIKARDIGANRLILAVAATHANRRAFDEARASLDGWELETRRVMTALAAGVSPARDAIVLI